MSYLDVLKEQFKIVNEELLLEYLDLKSNHSNDIRKERFEEINAIIFGNNWIDGQIMKFCLDKDVSKVLDENKIGLNVFSKEIESFIKSLDLKDFDLDNNDFLDR